MKQTKELVIKELEGRGFLTKGRKFYEFRRGDDTFVGMQVGEYVHCCHIEISDIKVLLCIKSKDSYYSKYYDTFLEEVWDLWDKEV